MTARLLLLALSAAAFSSCSTAYKSGQTPDDVYYSPYRTYGEETITKRTEPPRQDTRQLYRDYSEERQIRLGFNDPRWRYFDNDISYNPYLYGYNYGYYYNPYYCSFPVYNPVVITTPVNPKVVAPRTVNLAAYGSTYNNTNNYIKSKAAFAPANTGINGRNATVPAPRTNGSKVGNTLNTIFNNSNNSNSNNSRSTESNRTYTPSSSSSGSSSSSSSSGSSSSPSRPARSGRN